jgi:hypothetical protein
MLVADIDGDGIAEIIAARGAGYRPYVEVVKGGPSLDTSLFPPTLRNGIFLG